MDSNPNQQTHAKQKWKKHPREHNTPAIRITENKGQSKIIHKEEKRETLQTKQQSQ
jgi:hypothetical protein